MNNPAFILVFFTLFHFHSCHNNLFASAYAAASAGAGDGGGGKWALLQQNLGIVAMHIQLLHNDKVVIYDRTDFGLSNISLPDGKCRYDPNDKVLAVDCTAHSVEYDVASNSVRPLTVTTDVWCSSGAVTHDGSLVQTGGFNDGDHVVRVFRPCDDSKCDWEEIPRGLIQRRWYATSQILPDGRQIVIGGRRAFSYEFYPKSAANHVYSLRFLVQTSDKNEENNLYPFVFLNVDGNLFIFANNRAILFDYTKNVVVRNYPQLLDGQPRCYPSTGSAVLLPITTYPQPSQISAEVLVCGGAPRGAYTNAKNGKFLRALNTCGRIVITDPNPNWVVETMPRARVMGDMVTLPNGNILIINGAAAGSAGWEFGRDPVLNPVIYRPEKPVGARFELQNPSTIPRMYHSTALLVRDGRVLVGGSNAHELYNFTNVLFPTELRLEAFSPSYLDPAMAGARPSIISPASHSQFGYGKRVPVQFHVSGPVNGNLVTVTLVAPSFNTHSFSMNQRLLVIGSGGVKSGASNTYQIDAIIPGSGKLAPAGYYMLFVVHQDMPSEGIWVHIP